MQLGEVGREFAGLPVSIGEASLVVPAKLPKVGIDRCQGHFGNHRMDLQAETFGAT